MSTAKRKGGAALVLVVGILGAGAGLVTHPAREADPPAATQNGERRAQPKRDQPEGKQDRTDGRDDPLPEGAARRFGSARLRHGGKIYASALSPDGKTLATAGAHSVIVWNLDTGKALHRFGCDRGNSFCGPGLTFSPDGTRLGYVRNNFFACVWDLRTGKEVRRLERRFEDGLGKFWESGCRFVNRGKELVLISRDAIETWNVESGQMTSSLPVEGTRIFSPDGTIYLRNVGNAVILGDTRTGKGMRRLTTTRTTTSRITSRGSMPCESVS